LRHGRNKYIKNAPNGNGSLFLGNVYQAPYNRGTIAAGAVGQQIWETSILQRYTLGTRIMTPDGRVFRYAKASNIISVRHFGLKFWGQIGDGIAAVAGASSIVGDYTVTLTGTATKNEYAGGYLSMWSTPHQFRTIVSNTATSGTTFVVTLGEPLTVAVTVSSTWCEALQSPYANVRLTAGPSGGDSGNDYSSVAGIPFTITAAANTYLWIQTWGPCIINPHGSSLQDAGITGGERKLVFDVEGSVCIEDDAAHGPGADGDEHQIAGFIIDRTAASTSGPPLIMLTICP